MSESKNDPPTKPTEETPPIFIDPEHSGILDPEGKNPNPLTGEPYSEDYKKLAQIWSRFPAYQQAKEIIQGVKDHQVLLVTSGTGSGKTVLVPKFVAHALNYQGKIVTTLPKQIITQSAAEFAAKTLDVKLGKQVGYKYRGAHKSSMSSSTKLLYATDGTVVAKLLRDEKLEEFEAVIIDEAHERKTQIDFMLYLLKNLLKVRPDFKVVIMSATINTEIFQSYFSDFKFLHFDVGGKTNYPIKSIFLPSTPKPPEYLEHGFEIIKKLLAQPLNDQDRDNPDILFFITSSNEAIDLCKKMDAEYGSKQVGYCIEVYSGMDPERQKIAQEKTLYREMGAYQRKVVVATNVAESSLTVDGIGYVIDSGFEFRSSYDPVLRARKLDKQLISRAQAKQRMGRAGRTAPGVCYHLYSEADFKKMEAYPAPDIRRNNLTSEILNLLQVPRITNLKQLVTILAQFIEPPREPYVRSGIEQLVQLGAIDRLKLTPLGSLISQTTLDPPLGLALLHSIKYFCHRSILKIVAMLEASKGQMMQIFTPPQRLLRGKSELAKDPKKMKAALDQMEKRFTQAIKRVRHSSGDHLSLLKIFDHYFELKAQKEEKAERWAYDNFIKTATLFKARKSYHRLKSRLSQIRVGEEPVLQADPEILEWTVEERVLYCLYRGYRGQIANKIKNSEDYRIPFSSSFKAQLSDDTTLKDDPARVMYHELFISTDQKQLNILSRVPNKFLEAGTKPPTEPAQKEVDDQKTKDTK